MCGNDLQTNFSTYWDHNANKTTARLDDTKMPCISTTLHSMYLTTNLFKRFKTHPSICNQQLSECIFYPQTMKNHHRIKVFQKNVSFGQANLTGR